MKHKLSVTLDEELVKKIFSALSSGKYRNKSHVVEYAVQKLLENETSSGKTSQEKINSKIDSKSLNPKNDIGNIELINSRGDLDG